MERGAAAVPHPEHAAALHRRRAQHDHHAPHVPRALSEQQADPDEDGDRSEGPPRELWGVILFLACEGMFFAALFTTYFYLRGRLPEWQPVFGEKPTWLGLPLVNTAMLLASSVTVQRALNALRAGDGVGARAMLLVTIGLGTAFLLGQLYDFALLGFTPQDGVFASVFYLLAGFHLAHVAAGVAFLAYCAVRVMNGQWDARRHLGLIAASWYWQFVDVIWVGLFAAIYIIG